ncbi:aldehyde dehydrogenase family protein [Paraglaciecola chathamensis]|uniref:Salicylaldehyde dehydrogenase n=1 Tax=Paraglaciecola chathamensis TaxID=368405 RepID=A0A8H9IGM0_9ALTE|nr:aldehyde dehydrogenase family protein [Paraglaciecola oceanifecundans]GGZ79189.1 salicylaldehyde dehydrogenase [Paraglaciecola oceanifecundans]
MQEFQLFVNGEYTPATSGVTKDDLNPYTGEVYAVIHQANQEDAKHALDCAWQAYQGWKATLPSFRENIFVNAANIMRARADELKDILIEEAGATLLKANYEVHHTAAMLMGIAGECRRVTGETYVSDYPGVRSYSIRQSLGIIVAISPFNFPLLLAIRKIGWAMAAGNSVLLKPSEVTPVIALKIAEIFKEAGLPPGVLNVVPGKSSQLGECLFSDPRVKKVTFTGSTQVGKAIAEICAKYNTRVTLEMGGKNPIVVLKDADIDYAVNASVFSNYMNQGQVCMCGTRVIIEEDIYDEFVAKFTAKVNTLKHGNPRDPEVFVGPLIRPDQAPWIHEQVNKSIAEGAQLLTGGDFEDSVYAPTVLADVDETMTVFKTELFGPVAALIKAKDYKHAIELANNSHYGLSSAVFTNDLEKTMYAIDNIESGMVHVNGPSIRDEPVVPFGGVKDSGQGREGGKFSMDEFTELKWVTIQTGQQKFPI